MIDSYLSLYRKWYTDDSTVGELSLNDAFECYTLEDTVRKKGIKIPGKTAIPQGKYEIIINFSERFQRPMPLLLNVPGFDGIRIHKGNTSANSDGCILVGLNYNPETPNVILESKAAFNALFLKISDILNHGKLFINVVGGGRYAD